MMWKKTATTLFLGGLAFAGTARDPQNPFPAPSNDPAADARWSTFWWAEFDGDGAPDVLVLHPNAPLRLYRGTGRGELAEVTQTAGLAGVLGARQALWFDYDGDGRTDLFLTVPGGRSRLLRNVEGQSFEDVGATSGLALESRVLRAEVLDYDGDGAPDLLFVGPDRERLFRNLGAGSFEELVLELPERAPIVHMDVLAPARRAPLPQDEQPELDARVAPRPGNAASAPAGSSQLFGPTTGPTVTATPLGPQVPASAQLVCAGSVEDFVNPGTCMNASSVPTLGMLFPISPEWFVDPSGRVGLGTTSPSERLHVAGRILASDQIRTTLPTGTAPFQVASTTLVTNLNADLLDGLHANAFRLTANPIGTADLANAAVTAAKLASGAVNSAAILDGSIVNADVSASAAVAGTKIVPSFGAQNVVTTGRGGFGTTGPNSTLHVNAPAGDDAFRVQSAGATKLLVAQGGGVSIGTNLLTPPPNGLYVHGNLGVGNTAPTFKLDVTGDVNASGTIRQGGSVVVGATGLFFGKDTGWPNLAYNLGTSGLGMGSPSANNLAFQTLGLERLRITNSGRVGIGVSTPGFRLDLPNIASVDGQGRANAWTTYSSRRWKENVQTIPGALELVLRLRGVTFDWTAESGGGKDDVGFIAEEVGAVVPQLVAWEEDGVNAKSLKYDRISALTVEAIKSQQVLIEELRGELELERERHLAEMALAEGRVAELERQVAEQGQRLERVIAALAAVIEAR